MRMNMKRAAGAAVLGLMVLMQGGCTVKEETVCERVINYMSERYGDSFTCPVCYTGYPGSPVQEYFMDAEKLDGAEIKVEVRSPGTPEERYLDNYMGIKYRRECKEKIEDVLTDAFSCRRADLIVMPDSAERGLSNHWTPETSLDEYCTDPAAGLAFHAVIRSGEDFSDSKVRREMEHRLEDLLFLSHICCTGWIYFVPAGVDLKAINEGSFFDLVLKHNYFDARLFFNMKTAEGVDSFAWKGDGIEEEVTAPVTETGTAAADGND